MCFRPAALPRLKSTLWQDILPSLLLQPWKTPCASPRPAFPAGLAHTTRWRWDFLRQAYCRIPGSFRNLLVYLRLVHRVKNGRVELQGGEK